jgi:isoquinoline 1-oxidoreductase beta subunit
MGQGVNAGLAQVLGEELPLDWSKVTTQPAPFGAQYGRGATHSQVTGGSNSMRGWFTLMLQAGATARELLLAAARQTYPSAPQPLKAIPGGVQDAKGVPLATYGQLAALAATFTLPTAAPLLSTPSNYKLIGQKLQRPDVRQKVDGSAIFGIDVRLPGMVYASVKHCPTIGGAVASVPASSGGRQVINLGNAVAVTGPNTWAAVQAARSVAVTWTLPPASALALVDSTNLAAAAQTLMTSGTPATAESVGDTVAGLAAANTRLNLTYTLPFLAHACMEVVNCTVSITKNAAGAVTGCQIWAPTQAPDMVAATAAALTGLPLAQIVVTTTLMGGGLGRKIEQDYITQAITVGMALGKPVKLVWSREEDFARDWVRTSALSRVNIGLDPKGGITAWVNRVVAPSLSRSHGRVPKGGVESNATAGSVALSYGMGSRLVEYVEQPSGLQIGYWRSVGESISCFVVESAIDECARAMGIDPYQYRRTLLASNPAKLAVLDAVAKLAGWTTPLTKGHARGIALSPGFGSTCAIVAELALSGTGMASVVRISCAIDCGIAVNPDQVVGQMEGGILHGMNAALWQQVTFNKGVSSVRNFNTYLMGRMTRSPKIDVVIVNQGSTLGGTGEAGVPGVAPALANAYAALTGTRKRSLPLGFVAAPPNDD